MSRSAFAVKEVRVKSTRQPVNLCGSCGSEISASELLCKDCRHTLNPSLPNDATDEAPTGAGGRLHLAWAVGMGTTGGRL